MDEEEWTYELDEVGPEADIEEEEEPPLEPENPTLEGAAFVLVGALAAVLALLRMLPGL